RHVMPHLLSPVIVAFSLDVGAKILATAGLSFLGLGTQPPTADWGSMLATGRQFVILRPHVVLLPGLAIFVMVLALNLVGDRVRGVPVAVALETLLAGDPDRERRQVHGVGRQGGVFAHTGAECVPWCGHQPGDGFSVAGNMLVGPEVLTAMANAFTAAPHSELA